MLFEDNTKGAIISPCTQYRYQLWRIWNTDKPTVMFIGLNPSKADHLRDDNTMTRCKRFAFQWGFGGMYMMNLFAFRTTYPAELFAFPNPVGSLTDENLIEIHNRCEMTILCWGNDGKFMNRDQQVLSFIKKNVHYMRKTKAGHPEHPLYLPGNLKPIIYDAI